MIPLFRTRLFHQWVPAARIRAHSVSPCCRCSLGRKPRTRSPGRVRSSLLTAGPADPWICRMVCRGPVPALRNLCEPPAFWSGDSAPFHCQTSDFSTKPGILTPASLVKSLCKHTAQADLFKSLCNSRFPSACQTTRTDPLDPSPFPASPPRSLPCCHKPTPVCTFPKTCVADL